MFKRNDSKLLSIPLIGTALVTGLMAQGAAALVNADHEVAALDRNDGAAVVVETGGPRGEVLVRQENEGREQVADNRGGPVGPLPIIRSN